AVIRQWQEECGGCRLEDVIIVTEGEPRILPAAPKELADIYAIRDKVVQK
ncbi:hypothetical protein KIPB_006482, partial [Kipferlia bialata]